MLLQHRPMATPNVDMKSQLVTLVHLLTKHLLLALKWCLMLLQHRLMATPNVDTLSQLGILVHLLTKYLLLNIIMVPNARTTSPDGYSQCGHTKSTSDTCASFKNILSIFEAKILKIVKKIQPQPNIRRP